MKDKKKDSAQTQVKWMIIKTIIFSETQKSVICTPFPEEDPAEVNYLTRKKSFREKTMIKNFSNAKEVLVTTISAQKPCAK